MKHNQYEGFTFVQEPEEFSKHSPRTFLSYCLGAAMYMPGTKDFTKKILEKAITGLTTIVFCFEDACPEEDVPAAEKQVHKMLNELADAIEEGKITEYDLPLIFCRVRSPEQFDNFLRDFTDREARILAGFNFPKFNTNNAEAYFFRLKEINQQYDDVLYGMPIIEDSVVAYVESRIPELLNIKHILDRYKDLVLQVRVGATDFSSCFGARRGVNYSIYDIETVKTILTDILNIFSRNNDYVVSGPVWEYFRASKQMMFRELPHFGLEDYLLRMEPIVNPEVDGLLREIIMDKANGFVGRTVIHPSHVVFVNALQAVTKEEYTDAVNILGSEKGGVFKGEGGNKMNEVKPHLNWASKIEKRGRAYGVIENQSQYTEMFAKGLPEL